MFATWMYSQNTDEIQFFYSFFIHCGNDISTLDLPGLVAPHNA